MELGIVFIQFIIEYLYLAWCLVFNRYLVIFFEGINERVKKSINNVLCVFLSIFIDYVFVFVQ